MGADVSGACGGGVRHVVGLSGGKDSTALALRLREVHPDRPFEYICNVTGDELPEMEEHWRRLECLLGASIARVRLSRKGEPVTLNDLIDEQSCLPSGRIRYCTRMLKIQPTIDWVKLQKLKGDSIIMYVGLRADEETREGIYGDAVTSVFPFREWGWGIREVWDYLRKRGVTVPRRTDCARCYAQRIDEWYRLWRDYPSIWASARQQEQRIGHTFRRPGRDSWPSALSELEVEFARGRVPKAVRDAQVGMFGGGQDDSACRVCRL